MATPSQKVLVNTERLVKAILEERFEDADKFLEGDVDVDGKRIGDNVIHLATKAGNLNIIKKLINKKVDIQQRNWNGDTPMHIAAIKGRTDIAKYLMDNGADLNVENTYGDTPMHIAANFGRTDIAKYLMDNGAVLSVKNMYGDTPMHIAANLGRTDIAKYLMDNGADLSVKNKYGNTPMHIAAEWEETDLFAKYLMDNGADLSVKNMNGDTPMHCAARGGSLDIVKYLMDNGADLSVINMEKQMPEDVGQTMKIRESIRIYREFHFFEESGSIEELRMTLTTDSVKEPQQIDRVNIRLEYIDIPQRIPSSFYCRREQFEKSTVKLPNYDEEQIFSDVFHVRISGVNWDCPVKINIPLYSAPSNKEEIILRFIDYKDTDRVVSSISRVNEVNYCLLETKLIPKTTCVCALYVRPKMEEHIVTDTGMLIKSEIVENFSMDIPAGAFEEETTLSLKVFESNGYDTITGKTTGAHANSTSQKGSLLSDIFQINVSGQQPKKGINMQIPLSKSTRDVLNGDDIVIVTGDETKLEDGENTLKISKSKPKIINGVIVFNVSHFSIYVAASKDKVLSTPAFRVIKQQISNARKRKSLGVFFVGVKKMHKGLKYLIKIECCNANRSEVRRIRLVSKEYKQQIPNESKAIMMAPGSVFTITLSGNASLKEGSDIYRKLTFFPDRVSSQHFTILLAEGITDKKDATADVIIYQQLGNRGRREVAKLKVQLHLTPAPNSAVKLS